MSETTNLKLFKHDNPSTNTNSFDVEQALNENWNKIDTAVGDLQDDVEENNTNIDTRLTELETDLGTAKTDITNIKAEQTTQNNNIEANSTAIETNAEAIEQNKEDITDLQEENANLKAQIPTGQASGEEISLSDSAKMELIDFNLQGNSRQETLKGIQILQNTNEGATGWNVNSGDGAYTISSVVEDNINCMKALCTEQCNSYRLLRRDANLEKLKNNTDYTIQMDVKMNKTGQISLSLKNQDSSNVLLDFGNLDYTTANTWQTFKVKATSYATEINEQVVYIGLNPIYEVNDYIEIRNLILAEGDYSNTDLEWEPYTNLTLKPSLDYPSEVEAVGDNINLYPYENIPFQSDTTTESWCYVDGKIGAYGNTVTDKTDYKINLEKGEYYFKLETDDSNIVTGGLVANGSSAEKQLTLFDNAFEITETTVCTLRLKVANPSLGINIKSIKLEKGTVATPYSPYGQGSIEIVKSNKNILDLGQRTGNGITFNKNKITILNPSNYLYATNANLLNDKRLMGKTITLTLIANGKVETNNLSFNIGTNKNNYRFQKYYTVGNYNNDIYTLTRTLQNDEIIGSILIYADGNALPTCNLEINVQIEIADEATDFVEHEGNTYSIPVQKPFYKIENYPDDFTKQDGKLYEQHYIKEYIITGNENFVQSDIDRFYVINLITSIVSENSINCLSNYFKGDTYSNRWTANKVTVRTNSLTFCTNSGYTLDTFKAKLQELNAAGTPVKVYYILATPELIECTKEQTAVLEQIKKDGTFKEVTHFYTTEDLKPTIEVKYYKDLETLFNKQVELESTLNNVQAQLLELGGN